jgi:3-deoxy-D-manno-octulosonic-acid transferase
MTPEFHGQWGERTGPHVVFVGASYGELVIMRQLSAALQSRLPNARISWTIRDRHTIKHLMEEGMEIKQNLTKLERSFNYKSYWDVQSQLAAYANKRKCHRIGKTVTGAYVPQV